MIYENINGKLRLIKEVGFTKERELQTIVEGNSKTILNLIFIKSEFAIDQFRFDSVCYDEETKSFVIIEYKNGKNESLVDQGYAYLAKLFDRKAEFVLLYNEVRQEAKTKKDFSWNDSRIIFISPAFTEYQKNATSFKNMPFSLYEAKKYSNGQIAVNPINLIKKNNLEYMPQVNNTSKEVEKELKNIKDYTEDDHLFDKKEEIIELYEALKEQILHLGSFMVYPKKLYIAFKKNSNVCDVVIKKNFISIFINMLKGTLKDPLKLTRDVSNKGHWGNGDYVIDIKNIDEIQYALSLIKQSYDNN